MLVFFLVVTWFFGFGRWVCGHSPWQKRVICGITVCIAEKVWNQKT